MATAEENQKILATLVSGQRLAHAYLFAGEKGTGKLDTATKLAQSLFCTNLVNGMACQKCVNCQRVSNKNHPDVEFIKPEGNSIKVEQIQRLKEKFSLQSAEGGVKFYCIEDADLLTSSAANRLLTFLEEPPKSTYAVLITTRLEMIMSTILSRCQPLYFTAQIPQIFQKILEEQGISSRQSEILSYLTNNVQMAKELVVDEAFLRQLKLANQWFKLLIKRDERAFLFVQQELVQEFKERQKYQRLLDIIFIESKKELVKHNKVANQIIGEIVQAKVKIDRNVTPQSVCEQLALHIIGVKR